MTYEDPFNSPKKKHNLHYYSQLLNKLITIMIVNLIVDLTTVYPFLSFKVFLFRTIESLNF